MAQNDLHACVCTRGHACATEYTTRFQVCVCVCVRKRTRVRACVRPCVRVCVRACACVIVLISVEHPAVVE